MTTSITKSIQIGSSSDVERRRENSDRISETAAGLITNSATNTLIHLDEIFCQISDNSQFKSPHLPVWYPKPKD
jgi:hypothetical protein